MTIRELAKAAGVSTATVSRMLNKNGFVSQDARIKIKKAMKDGGYHPEDRHRRRGPSGSSAAFLKHRNFTMLWTSGVHHSKTGTGQELMQGITEALRPLGASLTVDYIDADGPTPKCLAANGNDGIFLHGDPLNERHAKLIRKIPSVWLLQVGGVDYGDRVQPNHRHTGISAYKLLEAQGCKNVCCISHTVKTSEVPYWGTRKNGFLQEAKFGKIKYHDIHTKYSEHLNQAEDQIRAAVEVVDQYIKLTPRPDGIFVANAMGPYIHAELKQRGIIPMKDVYMICGDVDTCGQYLSPEPVMIDIQGRQIGKLAVDAMLWRIKHADMDKVTHLLEPRLLIPKTS